MDLDPFSDILQLTNAEALLTGGFTAGGPWAIRFPAKEKIKFFAVVKGGCWVRLEGVAEPGRVEEGDVGLLAVPRSFVLASDLDVPPVDAMELFSAADGRTTARLGDGADFAYLGGHVQLDPIRGRLLADVLPPWIHIEAASPQAPALRWLMDQLIEEQAADLPGARLASAQLTQLLFIQILRAHLKAAEAPPVGWLRALRDPRVAPALRLMHGDPARAWRLEDLAGACGMSRTSFIGHFKAVSGDTPLGYLAAWRMRLAERALRDDVKPLAAVAQSLGYASDSAFSNAFKRVTGHSPTAFRSAAREALAAAEIAAN